MEFSGTSTASSVLRSLLDQHGAGTGNDRSGNSTTRTTAESLLQPSLKIVQEKPITLSNGRKLTLKPKHGYMLDIEKRAVEEAALGANKQEPVNMKNLYEKVKIKETTMRDLQKYDLQAAEMQSNVNELKKLTDLKNGNGKKGKKANTLWTEKYRPRKFIDLIGNEKVNAGILRWLNEWNHAVKNGKLINNGLQGLDAFSDPLKRPRKKVLLIHGPPGIGKTTIAQCVCRQLGYEMQEINSSDERGGTVVKEKVKNALKMRSLSGKNVCLLLDEIDGAGGNEGGFIKVLTYLLHKDKKATEEWNSFHKFKYNKKEDILKRPIIAMCNDLGAHCLEQLKPYCEIVSFKKGSKRTIKKRLKAILINENIRDVNESLLDDLIVSLDGDIRNCINFLQFNSKDLNGRVKDSEVLWFQLLKDIFNLENKNVNNKKSKSDIFRELMTKLTNSSSDLNRINMGCFNLMLQLNDEYGSNLNKLDEVSDWLYFQDIMGKHFTMFDRDEYQAYGAITPLKFFRLFANFSDGNYYDKSQRFKYKSQENFELRRSIQDIVNKLMVHYGSNLTKQILLVNEIYMLNYIIIPNVDKNKSIKEFEHDKSGKICKILKIMESLDIKVEMGALKNNGRFKNSYITYNKLQPDIVIGLIDPNCVADKPNRNGENGVDNDYDNDQGNNVNEIRAMPYIKVFESVLRLSQQRELRELKRLQELGDDEDGDEDDGDRNKRRRTGTGTGSPSAAAAGGGVITSGASGASDRGAEKQGMDPSETTDATAVDTFKRKYSTFHMHLSGKSGGVNTADNGRSVMAANENRIWVKYNEGFSNAVRKELVWKDLF